MNELEIITKQFIELSSFYSDIPEINGYNYPVVRKRTIGSKTSKFTVNNYVDRYGEIITSNNFQLIFYDESVISFFYEFDDNGEISKYNLSFIPSIDNDIDISDYILNEEVKDLLLESYADYIRIDFDDLGYEKVIHTRHHMHRGINKHGKDCVRNEIRFPISHVLYPFDFIYIICRYVYHVNEELLKRLHCVYSKRTILEDEELDLLCISFSR